MNLAELYMNQLRNPQEIAEQTQITENCHGPKKPEEVKSKKVKSAIGGNKKKSMKQRTQKNESFDSLFQTILQEADEYENFGGEEDFGDDQGFDDGVEGGDDFGADDTITVSRSALEDLKAQIDALLSGTDSGEEYDDGFDYDSEESFDDDIPKESRWDGTLSPQAKSKLVKDNGDVNFDQELDFDPTEDNDGEVHTGGSRAGFDGKLNKQKPTDHVKGNGDANFGKVKTGFKRTDKTGNKLFGK